MKKLVFTLLSVVLLISLAKAQDIPIYFETQQESYDIIENATSLNNGEVWEQETSYQIDFGFEFQIYERTFTTLVVNAGIGITFPGFNPPRLWIWGSEWGGGPTLIDRGIDASESPLSYIIVGDSGSRTLKIQWQNAGIVIDGSEDDPDDFVNFQMWICEESDKIEVHYGHSETSEISFGYNDGPGMRYFHIDGDWGICIFGFEEFPSWDWVLFDGPIGGCLLNGVPPEEVVFNFFPNPTVSVNDFSEDHGLDLIVSKLSLQNIQIQILDFQIDEPYELTIYNAFGIIVGKHLLNSKLTMLSEMSFSNGLYIFVLMQGGHSISKKVLF